MHAALGGASTQVPAEGPRYEFINEQHEYEALEKNKAAANN
jgi:hypothetical protein